MPSTNPILLGKLYGDWLDVTSQGGGDRFIALDNWSRGIPTDAKVNLLVLLLNDPAARQAPNIYLTATANHVFSRDDLTVLHARQLAEVFLQVAATPSLVKTLITLHSMDRQMASLISAIEDCDISTMGSLCRLVDQHGIKVPQQVAKVTFSHLLQAKNCPVEVIARVLTLPGREGPPQSKISESYWGKNFQQVAVTAYPDLVGLPEKFIAQVVSTQPIPDAWFVNMWEADKFRPPGSARPFPWVTSWGEVVAER